MSLAKDAWEAFLKLWQDDEEQAQQWLEDNPAARNRAIEVAGMITRKDEEAEEKQELDSPQEPEQPPPELEIDDEVVGQVAQRMQETDFVATIVTRLVEAETVQQKADDRASKLEEQFSEVVKRLTALEVDEESKLKQKLEDLPAKFKRKQSTRVVYRPRTRSNGKNEDEEEVDEMVDETTELTDSMDEKER